MSPNIITPLKQHLLDNELYKSLFHHHPDAIYVMDLKGNYVDANPAHQGVTGYSRDELLRLCFTSLIVPEDLQRSLDHFDRTVKGEPQSYEISILHKDGRCIEAQVTSVPIRVDDQVIGVYGMAKDITEHKHIEYKLRNSEADLAHAQHIAKIGSWERDESKDISYWSKEMYRIFGLEPDEKGYVPQEIFYQYIHPDDLVKVKQSLKEAFSGKPFEIEYRIILPCGEERVLHSVRDVTFDEVGKVTRLRGTVQDVTERKQAEEELRATKELLESFIQNTTDAITVVDLDGNLLKINNSFETIYGWKAQEVLGAQDPIIPEFLMEEIKRLRSEVKKGGHVSGYETLRKCKDGSLIDVSVTMSPVRNAEGEIIALSNISRDITQRKRAEEALAEAEAKYRSLVDEALVGVFLSHNSFITYVNPRFAEIFGYPQHELLGINGMDLCWIEDRPILEEQRQKMRSSRKVSPVQLRGIRKDGRIIHVELHGTLTLINGVPSVIGTLIDITNSKQTQDLLLKSEKLAVLGQLAAGVGHEIRNPLTSIKGFVQLLQTKIDNYHQYFEIILSELNRINSIVSEFMVLAKPQAVNFQPKNIVTILQEVLPLLETHAILTNVQIFTVYGSGIPLIHCEENQIKQVFINILKNSLEAMPNGGKIFVKVKKLEDAKILIRFTDEGCGIPEELLSKLGEPFYTTKENGTGLGLMVSHKIIENHKGKIHIMSEIGKGTTVDVILPMVN